MKIIKFVINAKNRSKLFESFLLFINEVLIRIFYEKRIGGFTSNSYLQDGMKIRLLNSKQDIEELKTFIESLDAEYIRFFHPHGFTFKDLLRVKKLHSMLAFGVFDSSNKMIAYGLLKLYFPQKAFIGRLVHPDYSGKGLGAYLGKYLYDIIYSLKFQGYSTISKYNLASIKSHLKNGKMQFVEKIDEEYSLYKHNIY